MPSDRRRSPSSTRTRSSPTWATSTTRRRSATSTTSHDERTRRPCRKHSAGRHRPMTVPLNGNQRHGPRANRRPVARPSPSRSFHANAGAHVAGSRCGRIPSIGIAKDARVCSRCGDPAGEDDYCQTCGLNLAEQRELPTRGEWERKKRPPVRSSSGISLSAVRQWAVQLPRKAKFVLVGGLLAIVILIVILATSGNSYEGGCQDAVNSDPLLSARASDSEKDNAISICTEQTQQCADQGGDTSQCDIWGVLEGRPHMP